MKTHLIILFSPVLAAILDMKLSVLKFLVFGLALTSCSKKEYNFQIINNTEYKIDDFGSGDLNFSILPYGQTEEFDKELINNCICFTSPQTQIAVRTFSDSLNTYDYIYGVSYVTSGFDKKNLNRIEIRLADSIDFPNYVFVVEFY